jgi:hypothetical protein
LYPPSEDPQWFAFSEQSYWQDSHAYGRRLARKGCGRASLHTSVVTSRIDELSESETPSSSLLKRNNRPGDSTPARIRDDVQPSGDNVRRFYLWCIHVTIKSLVLFADSETMYENVGLYGGVSILRIPLHTVPNCPHRDRANGEGDRLGLVLCSAQDACRSYFPCISTQAGWQTATPTIASVLFPKIVLQVRHLRHTYILN